jgi:hypothetical protein
MAGKFALIIGVEEYNDPKIPHVKYAENDAKEFVDALQLHEYSASNIMTLLSSAATKTTIESKSRTLLSSASLEDEIVVFYAGHGFAENDKNYLTCGDTVQGDLVRTSIPLQELFGLFRKSVCKRILFFLDTCHSGFDVDESMRGIMSEMNDAEFKKFIKDSEYHVVFASSDTDQYSYSSNTLRHGIWSYHIIEALKGNAKSALERSRFLTVDSLLAFLKQEVPRTIRKTFSGAQVQTPRLLGNCSGTFLIADFKDIFQKRAAALSPKKAQLKQVLLSGVRIGNVKSLSGFKKGSHSVPKACTNSTREFVAKIGRRNVEDYANKLFSGLRSVFKYKLGDVDFAMNEDESNARLLCKDFTVYISLALNDDDPSKYLLRTEVTEIRNPEALASEEFNRLFANTFDSLTFKSDREFGVEALIKAIEDVGDEDKVSVNYPGDISSCTIKVKGLDASIVIEGSKITMVYSRNVEVKELVGSFHALQRAFLGHGIVMLPPSK